MPALNWNKKYSVNIALIDEQHKKIVELLNVLSEAIAAGKAQDVLAKVMEEVMAYAKYHFKTEESLLTEHKFPGLAEHKKEHEGFAAKAALLYEDAKKGKPAVVPETVRFLIDWLDHHIVEVDQKYSAFLNSKGIF